MLRRISSFILTLGLVVAGLIILGLLTSSWWLPALGNALVTNDGPAKADVAVVLAGDFYGHRIEKAAELVKQGYVPAVLVSGPQNIYGSNEATLAERYIEAKGFPPQWFITLPTHATSTREEAFAVLPELHRRNVRNFLLVTSDFHTARAGRIYRAVERRLNYYPAFRTVAAPDEYFRAGSWWRTREGQKTAFIEWSKTIAAALGK